MKTIFTILSVLLFTVAMAQDKVFVHTATTGNITSDATELDHPDLNGNPSAMIMVTHNLNYGGVQYNNHVTGTYYNTGTSKWMLYNENSNPMAEGSSYNIYIIDGGEGDGVVASGTEYRVRVNNPSINGNPDAIILYANYYNTFQVRNDNNYGVYYDNGDDYWYVYNESTDDNIPAQAAFDLLIGEGTGGATAFKHTATTGNITANYTVIDHPSLNGKPEAYPVITHNWGSSGDLSNILLDRTLGVWYNGNQWTIYTEDSSTMPENALFNVYVADEPLGVENEIVAEITSYPNPTAGEVTFGSKEVISNISIYNLLGQEVKQITGNNSNNFTIDISGLSAGNYIAKVQAGKAVESIKLIKQ
ncbi:T9SS type A sorting domain-containing protein [Marixanthomonas ophiurae]|uniref:T9SS C-terminal target domain-containing protein n=1 Tax=Marixanthomonas ophiurae TaxID=387659 RepID=A0A3E1Q9V7_9FLAO|nr:T9SS type A sorting domain-containing protein [Marixanthomonas ophiurae]RFN58912.1 T9SS C-terminal target domain-containing protein [Marixanthomonas ophiurae]